MFLIDEKMMLNRAVMTFWGLRVGEVLISFPAFMSAAARRPATERQAPAGRRCRACSGR